MFYSHEAQTLEVYLVEEGFVIHTGMQDIGSEIVLPSCIEWVTYA